MGKHRIKEHAEFIKINAPGMTIKELVRVTKINAVTLYSYLHRYNISFVHEYPNRERRPFDDGPDEDDEPKQPIKRFPAVYSNHSPFGIAS